MCEHEYGKVEVEVNEEALQDWQQVSFADGDYFELSESGHYRLCVYETSAGFEQGYCAWQIDAWESGFGWYYIEIDRTPRTVDVAYNRAKRQLDRYESGELMPGDRI